MTVVMDCNILVMCLTSRSPWHLIYQSLTAGKYELAVSNDILLEYEEVIQQKYGIKTSGSFMALLNELPNVHFINPHYKWMLINEDPDDNKYCDCAIAGKASHIVSEDNHFSVLKTIPFPNLSVISIEAFFKILQSP